MRRSLTTFCICLGLMGPSAMAQMGHENHGEHGEHAGEPVNTMCPIGQESVEADAGTIEYKGKTIGFCCPGCSEEFAEWDEAKKDEFVALAVAHREPGTEHNKMGKDSGADVAGGQAAAPYLLTTCPISGETFGAMGDPFVKVYEGREVRFCCDGCAPDFEKNLDMSLAKMDEQIIKNQLPMYPLTMCVVSGEEFEGSEDMGEPINFVYGNRLVRFCCKMCRSDFKDDPAAYLAKLDEAVIAQQSEDYPLKTCPISGNEIKGEAKEISKVYGNRLVKFCCAGCVEDFEEDPTATMMKLDAAWMAAGHPEFARGFNAEGGMDMDMGG
ncbi:MAG TPA: TRASH domain-containing protein [Phycisphaerales bacterium]|nr:TRASH domain-containing protein [Phycisphaerales bacterium]